MLRAAISPRLTRATVTGALAIVLAAAILFLPVTPALWLVAGGALVALLALAPVSAFLLLPFAIAFGSLFSLSIAGMNIGPTDLLVGVALLVWLVRNRSIFRRTPSRLQMTHLRALWMGARGELPVLLALVAYLLIVCLSLAVATDRVATFKEIIKWSEVLAVVALSAMCLRTAWRLRAVVWATIAAAVAEAFLGYAQWAASSGTAGPGGESLRVFGTFGQPNPYGGFLNFGLLLALGLALFGRDTRERWLAGGAGVLLLGAQVLASSRGALLGLAAGVLVMVIAGLRREKLAAIVAAVAIPLAVIAWIVGIVPSRIQRTVLDQLRIGDALSGHVNSANFSTVERLAHWVAGARMFVTHPLLGVGAGNYDAAYVRYALPDWPDALGHAHNYYINAAAETGALGGLAFLALTAATIYLGWHTARRMYGFAGARSDLYAIALGLLGVVVALAVHNLTDDLFVHAMELQFALTIGCQLALLRLAAGHGPSK